MFKFRKEQEIVNIAGVKVGGQPGELPTVLAGTIFYRGHKILKNESRGTFDKNAAETLVNIQETNSDETGNPHMLHIYGTTPENICSYIDFISEITDAPFIIDSSETEVRKKALEYVTEVGLSDRTIYNSINMSISKDEEQALKNSDVFSSIILGFNAIDSSMDGRMKMLENGGGAIDRGLLEIAEDCGISNIMVDPSITPMGNGAGIALRMTANVKAKWGYPTGSGIHNAPSSWNWLKEQGKKDPLVYRMCDISSTCMQQMATGDFVLYGPIENAPYTFPVAAMGDIMVSEASAGIGTDLGQPSNHPINRLL
jgi:tetrahydromethanopterin S-methyltransferase subunit H